MKKQIYVPRYECSSCNQGVDGDKTLPLTKGEAELKLRFAFIHPGGTVDLRSKIPHYHKNGDFFGVAHLIALVAIKNEKKKKH